MKYKLMIEKKLERELGLTSPIDETKNGNGRFILDTDLKDFAEGIRHEVNLPNGLYNIFRAHGYTSTRGKFSTIRDLILSYRDPVVGWSELSRGRINYILAKYGFQELAPKRHARSKSV